MKKVRYSFLFLSLLSLLVLSGCSSNRGDVISREPESPVTPEVNTPSLTAEPEPTICMDTIQLKLDTMSTEEKVAQLFIISPEALSGAHSSHTSLDDDLAQALNKYPVGWILFFGGNLQDSEQTSGLLSGIKNTITDNCGIAPFLAIDEEGGSVARIASNKSFGVDNVGDMRDIGHFGSCDKAYAAAEYISGYLNRLGFNLNFAPVADVFSNSANTVVKYRSFGSDPQIVSEMVISQLNAFSENKIFACPKHFPGHGSTGGDTHSGMAYSEKSWSELLECELIPFISSIEADAPIIMVGHFSLPNVTGDYTPCSLSYEIITEKLKNELGFSGLVVTDDLSMGAIMSDYSAAGAAKAAFLAGADILLMSDDFPEAYRGILSAVNSGEISGERLNESVYKIISLKASAELLTCIDPVC